MKTRLKIIIVGIVLASIVFGTYQSLMYQCGTLPVFMETPRNPTLWNCLEIWGNQSEQHPNAPPPVNLTLESQHLMQKAQSLGIDNVMEAVDSEELSFDQKREYIKIRYEESPKSIPSLNIRIKDLTRNLESGERPTFNVIETGYANPCTHPKLEVYYLKGKTGHDLENDQLVYQDQIVYPCPFSDSFSPVLKFWDETDFEPFPICEKEGRYIVVGDSGFERTVLEEYYCNASNKDDDFEETFGGPGNRHPAFWGFDIPQTCTEDMIKHLMKYSTMFDRDAPYSLDWIGLGPDINEDDFNQCVEELLEKNPKELENEN